MQVSASTSTAPTSSARWPITTSRTMAARRTPPQESPIVAVSAAGGFTRFVSRRSGERPDVFLQQRPGLVAGLLLHVTVEPGLLQRLPEGLYVGRIEDHALAGQVLGLVGGHVLPVAALGHRRGVEVLARQILQIVRQLVPVQVAERVMDAGPHVVAH